MNKKTSFSIIVVIAIISIHIGCVHRCYPPIDENGETISYGVNSNDSDSVPSISPVDEAEKEYDFQSQAELNAISMNWSTEYNDSIEKEFQILVSMLPQYEEELIKENTVWNKYHNAVRKVADCENHGSSAPMYVSDVVRQGILLRETSWDGSADP